MESDLLSLLSCLMSPDTTNEARQQAECFLKEQYSIELVMNLKIIIENYSDQKICAMTIVILCDLLKNDEIIERLKELQNVIQFINDLFFLSLSLMSNDSTHNVSYLSAKIPPICLEIIQMDKNVDFSPFFHLLLEGLSKSTKKTALHSFCDSIKEVIESYSLTNDDVVKLILIIMQKLSESNNDVDMTNELLILCNAFCEEEDFICFFYDEESVTNEELLNSFLGKIFLFLDNDLTYVSSIKCFGTIASSYPVLISFFFPLIMEKSLLILENNRNREILLSCCDFFYSVTDSDLSDDLNFSPIIVQMFKILSSAPFRCDLKTDWEPHISAQKTLFLILSKKLNNEQISESIIFFGQFMNSSNFGEKAAVLVFFIPIINRLGEEFFLQIKDFIINCLKDESPRVRENAILCIHQYVLSIQNNCCDERQFNILNEVFYNTIPHISESQQPEVSKAAFHLFLALCQKSGFECSKPMSLIFSNFQYLYLNQVLSGKDVVQIKRTVKNAHYSLIHSFDSLLQSLILLMQDYFPIFDDLFYLETMIIIDFIERFDSDLVICKDYISLLVGFALGPTGASFYLFGLTGIIFSKLDNSLIDEWVINTISQICLISAQFIRNNQQDSAKIVNCIQFYKYLLPRNLIQNKCFPMIIETLNQVLLRNHNFEEKAISLNTIFLLCKEAPSLFYEEKDFSYLLENYISILNPIYLSVNFTELAKVQIFPSIVESMELILAINEDLVLFNNQEIIIKFISFIIYLYKLSLFNINRVMNLFVYLGNKHPNAVKAAITDEENNFCHFVKHMQTNRLVMKKIEKILQTISLDNTSS